VNTIKGSSTTIEANAIKTAIGIMQIIYTSKRWKCQTTEFIPRQHIENLTMPRNIANEILEGLQESSDYLDEKPTGTRTTTVNVPGRVDVRSIREGLP
jgi:hypothetical protein